MLPAPRFPSLVPLGGISSCLHQSPCVARISLFLPSTPLQKVARRVLIAPAPFLHTHCRQVHWPSLEVLLGKHFFICFLLLFPALCSALITASCSCLTQNIRVASPRSNDGCDLEKAMCFSLFPDPVFKNANRKKAKI